MTRISREFVQRALLLVALAFTAWMELGLRRHLYHVLGHASVVAGSMSNFVAVVLVTLFYVNLRLGRAPMSNLKAAVMATLVMTFYELVQPWIPGRVFDVNDVLASFAGGAFAFVILSIVDRFFKPAESKATRPADF